MKALITILIVCLTSSAFAKNFKIKGQAARTVMEAMIGSNLGYYVEIEDPSTFIDDHGVVTSINPITCTASRTNLPDDLLSWATCSTNNTALPTGPVFDVPNSLALAKALLPYAYDQSTDWVYKFSITSATCDVVITTKTFVCYINTAAPN